MAADISIPFEALVAVVDQSKALFFINKGPALSPALELFDKLVADANPPTHEQGSDRPGRPSMNNSRSAYSQTDWHRIAATAFIAQVSGHIVDICKDRSIKALVIFAPPRALSNLRSGLPDPIKNLIVAEYDKDLTHMPVEELNRYLAA